MSRDEELHLSGLQIFTPWAHRNNKSSNHSIMSDSYSYSTAPSDIGSPLVNSPLTKFVDWENTDPKMTSKIGSRVSSPRTPCIDKFSRRIQLKNLIVTIFKTIPSRSEEQFLEEFKYLIVTCPFLYDLNKEKPLKPKQSVFNFKRNIDGITTSHNCADTMTYLLPTNLGRFRKSSANNRYQLYSTINYLSILLDCRFILRRLKRRKLRSRQEHIIMQRVVVMILMLIYLAIEQRYCHIEYLKYRNILSLKLFLNSLQYFDAMLNKFHLRFKELSIYKPLSIVEELRYNKITDTSSSNLMTVEELLIASFDQLYYHLKHSIYELLPISNIHEITKYCELYNISLTDLFYSINRKVSTIEEKSFRVRHIKRLFLCILLSIQSRFQAAKNISPLESPLSPIFAEFSSPIDNHVACISNIRRIETVTRALRKLNCTLQALSSTMSDYKHYLLMSSEIPDISIHSPYPESENQLNHTPSHIHQTLNALKKIETIILSQPSKAGRTSATSSILHEVDKIHDIWSGEQTCEIDGTTRKQGKYGTSSSSRIMSQGSKNGFHLDVFKTTPKLPEPVVNINEVVEFKTVADQYVPDDDADETELSYGFEDNVDEETHEETHEEMGQYTHFKTIKQLTDEELRNQLNAKIHKLSLENKKSRETLRTQKSFELLRHHDDDRKVHTLGRYPFKEESIPVIYELKRYHE
ncbi:Inp2p NDAI_0H03200 [Naumovozyma dairenensis CBS 421]|uniref:Inheritance of peroxisomes protein 2 n=1 Tax=Naumovozyma dairenensis (strain ATCC 10597 / BCRC 20456 / CBS 421 / NBRC 0211 / NRRL Y-12639) TaxID=1071378 RepID=G0WFD2_NAUDC|nr:hypothetical protein NDAI_0H03200 [Naumovozyma dairenensis CBS 421]CCD26493.1 hypothetical protein NDAI_0H03200 [Naumovozyma dairenensis CBS 421]